MKKSELVRELTQDYMKFLEELNAKPAPIFNLFTGKPMPEKKKTLEELLQFLSAKCNVFAEINPSYDATDLLIDLREGLMAVEKDFIRQGRFDGFVPNAKKICMQLYNYLRQKCIVENEEHDLSINLVGYKSIDNAAMKNIIAQNQNGSAEAIVCKDGTVYPVQDFHDTVIQFLIANNIDVSGAVRIDTDELTKRLLVLSSLQPFYFINPEFKEEKTIMVTDEQARNIYAFYEKAKNCVPKLNCSFEDVLCASENLGWQLNGGTKNDLEYYNTKKAGINLETFSDAVEKVHDSGKVRHRDQGLLDKLYDKFRGNNSSRRIEIQKNNQAVQGSNVQP